MKSKRLPSGIYVVMPTDARATVDPWPEHLGGEAELNGKAISAEIDTWSLGLGYRPEEPNTEYRQIDIRFTWGDVNGFRFIAVGVPLKERSGLSYTFVQPYDGGEIVLACCWFRLRFRDWPVSHETVIQPGGTLHSQRLSDTGAPLTKRQTKRIDQGLELADALVKGRFTLRGRTQIAPIARRDAARERLLNAAKTAQRSWKLSYRALACEIKPNPVGPERVKQLFREAEWKMRDLRKIMGKS